jgi:hypothetical protein
MKPKSKDTAWPPAGVRDLKPDIPVSDKADRVRFPILREALSQRAEPPPVSRQAVARAGKTEHVSKGMCDNVLSPTEFVRYRETWIGAVLQRERREYNGHRIGDLLTVVLLIDRHGKPMQRRIVMKIDAHWTMPFDVIDTSDVNPDWWRIPP